MDRKDLKALIPASSESIAVAAIVSTATGTGVDLKGYFGACVAIVAGARTDGTHTFEVQDSDDNSTFAAVADANLNGSEPVVDGTADDNQIYLIGYHGTKRYLRVKVTVTSATTGCVEGAHIIKGIPREQGSTLVD